MITIEYPALDFNPLCPPLADPRHPTPFKATLRDHGVAMYCDADFMGFNSFVNELNALFCRV